MLLLCLILLIYEINNPCTRFGSIDGLGLLNPSNGCQGACVALLEHLGLGLGLCSTRASRVRVRAKARVRVQARVMLY